MTKSKILINIVIYAILIICGFFIGRSTSTTKSSMQYLPGKIIRDTIPKPYPVVETIPSKPEWYIKHDTLWKDSLVYVTNKIDTAAILADWIVRRDYKNVMFDIDTIGKLIVSTTVQYNKLQGISYNYTPIHKVITNERKRTIEPFIMGGVSSSSLASNLKPTLQGGVFIKNIGISYDIVFDSYIDNSINKSNYQHSFKIGYKF